MEVQSQVSGSSWGTTGFSSTQAKLSGLGSWGHLALGTFHLLSWLGLYYSKHNMCGSCWLFTRPRKHGSAMGMRSWECGRACAMAALTVMVRCDYFSYEFSCKFYTWLYIVFNLPCYFDVFILFLIFCESSRVIY